jgi:diguanylate cyclase (GGDEF)-like protein
VFWLLGGLTIGAGALVPGAIPHHHAQVALIAVSALAFGAACLVAPWRGSPGWTLHVPVLAGLAVIMLGTALTGGGGSPFQLYLYFVATYCACFCAERTAVAYFVACAVAAAAPLTWKWDPTGAWFAFASSTGFFVLGVTMLFVRRQLEAAREAASQLSMHDSLTELPNRRMLMDALQKRVGGRRRTDGTGLLLIDVDSFKAANTLYGLPGGDKVLRHVAIAVRRAVREEDLVARLGGDEFAVVAEQLGLVQMDRLAERVLREVRRANRDLGLDGYHATVSGGWAVSPGDADTVEELVAVADRCLREAKLAGKDMVRSPLDLQVV